jgi:gluconate 2-dehydrogenase gamma chain
MGKESSATGPREGVRAGRRQVLQALAAGVGAGLALPGVARGAAARRVLEEHARLEQIAGDAEFAGTLPTFLDPHQRETLSTLAEAIIPGARAAGVPEFVDRLLAVDSKDAQRDFLAAMGALDAESVRRYRRPWTGLDDSRRTELLQAMSTTRPSWSPHYWKAGEPEVAPAPPGPPTLRDRFDLLKMRVAVGYYTSEAGQRELGWTGDMIHQELPGCAHAGGHPNSG